MKNKPLTFILVGRSGSGKGTQISLLRKFVKDQIPLEDYCFTTGDMLREFIKGDSPSQLRVREIVTTGKLVPDFITISLFVQTMLDHVKSDQHLFLDGIVRTNNQAQAVMDALAFFGKANPIIIDIMISPEEARKRMLKRGRSDDTEESINSRFAFYEKEVIPAIDYLKKNSGYIYLQINGERTIDEIFEDIKSQVQKLVS
jgi:adenylate kinase